MYLIYFNIFSDVIFKSNILFLGQILPFIILTELSEKEFRYSLLLT